MRVEILGCSGGIGGDSRTMCLLVDQVVRIGQGTLVAVDDAQDETGQREMK